ncbi:hypothetical protein ACHAP3_005842 [Botrytis cinerea]
MSSTLQAKSVLSGKRSRSTTASKGKEKRIQDLFKSLGFYPAAGSELKKKINVFAKSIHIPPLKAMSKKHPEARKLAESFCADKKTAEFLWPEVLDGNYRRLKWENDKIKILKSLTHIFAWKMHYYFKSRQRKEAQKNSLDRRRGLDSDDELLATPGHQNPLRRTQHPKTGQECSKAGATFNTIAKSSAMRSVRRTIDNSKLRELKNTCNQEICAVHIRNIKPMDDKKMMTEFVSPQWLENEEFSWTAQGGLEPDTYILRFMHGGDRTSRTQELDAAWEQRLDIWDQPSEGISEETEFSNTHRRGVYEISVSPDRDELTITCQQRSSDPKGSVNLSRKRTFQSTTLGDDVDREVNVAKNRRLSTSNVNRPPIIRDKGKEVDRGQSNLKEKSRFLKDGSAHATATTTLATMCSPETSNSKLNSTRPISPTAISSEAEIKSEPYSASNPRSGFLSSYSPFSDHLSTRFQPGSTDPKSSPLFTTPLQPITQTTDESASEDDLPLATFSNDIDFIFLSKQNFDYENPLRVNIKVLEDFSLSSFISLFAQRAGVNMLKVDGLKFTILLGDDRLETVMKGDERKWENIVEIIRDLWKYSKIQWVNGTKLKSRVCRILTERILSRAL